MRLTTIVELVALPDALSATASQAVRQAFPDAEIITAGEWTQAPEAALHGRRRLLVFFNPVASVLAEATQGGAADEAPRWTTVILGGPATELAEHVPAEDCTVSVLTRVFRSAVLHQELLLENIRLRGDLATVARRITHDLRTPLNCLQITGELMREMLPGQMPAAAQIAVLQSAVADASQVLERVGFLLRASLEPRTLQSVSLGSVLARVLERLSPEIQTTGASIAAPEQWPAVAGIASWLEVIWWNLLGNALQHGRRGAAICLAWRREGEFLHFSVSNGMLNRPRNLPSGPLRKFNQLHSTGGTGLGLSVVQRLVELQGGWSECDWTEGESFVAHFVLLKPA